MCPFTQENKSVLVILRRLVEVAERDLLGADRYSDQRLECLIKSSCMSMSTCVPALEIRFLSQSWDVNAAQSSTGFTGVYWGHLSNISQNCMVNCTNWTFIAGCWPKIFSHFQIAHLNSKWGNGRKWSISNWRMGYYFENQTEFVKRYQLLMKFLRTFHMQLFPLQLEAELTYCPISHV